MRGAIREIAANAEAAFGDGWPADYGLYDGGAGVVRALDDLQRRGLVELRRDYIPYLEQAADAEPERGLLIGETGIRLVLQRLAPSASNLERLAELIADHEQDPRCELMWGSPGTILAGRELGLDVTPSVKWLLARRDPDGLWTQNMDGHERRWLGPVHGFAGCVLALGSFEGVSETLRRLGVEEAGLWNWPPLAGTRLEAQRDGQIRMQWCHGAPGIVATLGAVMDENLALGGGKLTWRAGPLRKGAGLCHGTAGNGYAFLVLFERTGDEQWLARARAFAMHSLAQVRRSSAPCTLWTGDPGTALYLADCLAGSGGLPLP